MPPKNRRKQTDSKSAGSRRNDPFGDGLELVELGTSRKREPKKEPKKPEPTAESEESLPDEYETGYDRKRCGIDREDSKSERLTGKYWEEAKNRPIARLRVQGRVRCYDLEHLYYVVQEALSQNKIPLDPETDSPISDAQVARIIKEAESRFRFEEVGYNREKCEIDDEKKEREPYSEEVWETAKERPVIRLRIRGKIGCYDLARLYHAIELARATDADVVVPGLALPLTKHQTKRVVEEFKKVEESVRLRTEIEKKEHTEQQKRKEAEKKRKNEEELKQREENKRKRIQREEEEAKAKLIQRQLEEKLQKEKEAELELKTREADERKWEEEKNRAESTGSRFNGIIRAITLDRCENLIGRYRSQPILTFSSYGIGWQECRPPGCRYMLLSRPLYNDRDKEETERQAYYLYLLRAELLDGKPLVPYIYDAWICAEEKGADFGTAYLVMERYNRDMGTQSQEAGRQHYSVPRLFETGDLRRMFKVAARLGQLGIANLGLDPRSFVYRDADRNIALFDLGFAGVPANSFLSEEHKGVEKYQALGVGDLVLGHSCPTSFTAIRCEEQTIDQLSCPVYLNLLALEIRLLRMEDTEVYMRSTKNRVYVFGGIARLPRDTRANPCKAYTNVAVAEIRTRKLNKATSRNAIASPKLGIFELSEIIPSAPATSSHRYKNIYRNINRNINRNKRI